MPSIFDDIAASKQQAPAQPSYVAPRKTSGVAPASQISAIAMHQTEAKEHNEMVVY